MKLRNFLYINKNVLDDYISVIDGYTYDEETQIVNEGNKKAGGVKAGIPVLSGDGRVESNKSEEVQRRVRFSDSAKFEKIHRYLSEDTDNPLKYYEFIEENEFNIMPRDSFLEVHVSARFSKMKVLSNTFKKIEQLVGYAENLTEQKLLDRQSKTALDGVSALASLKTGKEIACVFSFEESKIPLLSYLNEDYFLCEQEQFVGQFYMLCKVQKKIPKGKSVSLDEIFEDIKNLPLNRNQRRKMPNKIDNPDIIKDVVKGPALQVIPIAIYQ